MIKRSLFCIMLALALLSGFPHKACAQGTLQFSRVLLVDANMQTVPAGTVWKLESVMSVSNMVPSTGTSDNAYYTISKTIEINSNVVVISRASRFTENYSRYNSESTTDIGMGSVTELPLWLPAGTTVKAGTNALYISVIEFNIVP